MEKNVSEQRPFTPGELIVVPATLLNNMAAVIYQIGAITPDQHRDLQNLMSLLRDQAVTYD